jgi:hypothetical protein
MAKEGQTTSAQIKRDYIKVASTVIEKVTLLVRSSAQSSQEQILLTYLFLSISNLKEDLLYNYNVQRTYSQIGGTGVLLVI